MSDISGAGKGFIRSNTMMTAPKQPSADEKLKTVANMYEKHFLREMLKAMRGTVQQSGLINQNQAEKIFSEKLDDEYTDKWADRGGIGLSNMIYNQLLEKFGVQMGLRSPVQKPMGPLVLDEKSQLNLRHSHPDQKTLQYEFRELSKELGSKKITNPWSGVLLNKIALNPDESSLLIGHDNGLQSQLTFRGLPSGMELGQRLREGENLGVVSPDSDALYWNIRQNSQNVSE